MTNGTPPAGDQPQPPPPAPAPRRRVPWVALAAVLLLAGAGAAWWYLRPKPYTPPEPPALSAQEGADKAVVAAVEKARQAVLAVRTSAAAWGELGVVFAAHGYEPEADDCFREAERLDPADPRWPYYRALFAAMR